MSVRKGSLKYVFAANGEQSLFDVVSDPNEDHDLLRSRPDAAAELAPFREEWEKRRANQPVYDAGEPAEGEIAQHLRMLGYLD